MTNILVSGANGFVGSNLCRKLISGGDNVRGLVRRTSDLSLIENIPIQKVRGSLTQPESLVYATQDIDTVYHVAAAVSDWGTLDTFRFINVEGTRNLLEACIKNKVKRFVYVSSVAVHSFIGAQNMDEDSPQLTTPFPYCQSKREAETLVLNTHRQGKIQVSIVRPGDVYGPGDRVVLLKMATLLERGMIATIDGGKALGAFTYVENLADGLILAGTKSEALGKAYVITDGIKLSWLEYFRKLSAALNVAPPRVSIPPGPAYVVASILESSYRLLRVKKRPPITRYLIKHLSRDFHFRIDKARRELGYEPRVGIDEAIERTADWYRHVVRGT